MVIDLRYVKKLLEMIDASSVNSIEITSEKGVTIRISKTARGPIQFAAPMVGTYYAAPEPGAKPYLSVGDRISKGQILCIIEAMKIMNEIESEFDGVVKEILAQNAHPVEYGQVLFRIDPNG